MRDVNIIKEKLNILRDELEKFLNTKNIKYPTLTIYDNLNDFDRHEFSYIMGCINSLKNQINVLEFVLNEDVEITDYTTPYPRQRACGISKEIVLKIKQ